MSTSDLADTARQLVARGKGILAADESTSTIAGRLAGVKVESTEETRRQWRQLLFTAPGIERYISGVILYDETIRQKTDDGILFPEVLARHGVLSGIKVDRGTKPLAGAPGEVVTEGLDGLRERLSEYRDFGARFTKWRAVFAIGQSIPSSYCVDVNAQAMARYAALAQEAGLVPIVEPEVLMDGDHGIDRCFEVTERALHLVFDELLAHRISFEGMLLKPNMVLSGKDAPDRAGPGEVADRTLTCLRRTVPAAVPGIVFLSGGQSDAEATANLDAINRRRGNAPWDLSFSYGRALQTSALQAWAGRPEKAGEGQQAFTHRAGATSAARDGAYTPDLEGEPARPATGRNVR
jgi:fructose-bisphosphate aldolase class I